MTTLKVFTILILAIALPQGPTAATSGQGCKLEKETVGFLGTQFAIKACEGSNCSSADETCCLCCKQDSSCTDKCNKISEFSIVSSKLGLKINGVQLDALLLSTVVQAVILPLFFLTATIVWVSGRWWLAKLSPALNWAIFLGLLATQGVIVWVIGAPENQGGSWSSAGDALRGAVLAIGGVFLLCSAWKASYRLWYFIWNVRKLGFYLAVLGPNLVEVKTKTATAYTGLTQNPGKFLVIGKNGPEVHITGANHPIRVDEGTAVEDLKVRYFGHSKIHGFKIRTSWNSAKTAFGLFEASARQNYGEAEGGLLE